MINAEEKEEDLPQREQKMQLPLRDIDENSLNLPGEPDEALPPGSKAMMSYPSRRPESLSPEIIDVEDKESINYYIDLAKQQPGKKLAIISKKTGTPLMGIKYDGSKVKISSGGLAMESNFLLKKES